MDAFDTSSFVAKRGAFPVGDAQPVAGNSLTADLYRVKLYGKWHFLKKLKPELAGNPAYVAAFEKEFDIGFNLDHPNIVRYVSVGDDGTAPYLLTQYVDGLTLAEFVSKNPGYFKNKAHFRAFVAQVLSAVGYMHSRQVLHLDLKPGNVMLTNVDRQVKIVDLGFSYSDLYQHDTAGYTATFAAPEQLAGGEKGTWTDVYAVARLCVFAYTDGQGGLADMPLAWRRVLGRCLVDEPERRVQTVDDVEKLIAKGRVGRRAASVAALIVALAAGMVFAFSGRSGVGAVAVVDTVYVKSDSVRVVEASPETVVVDRPEARPSEKQLREEYDYYRAEAGKIWDANLIAANAQDSVALERSISSTLGGLARLADEAERRWPGSRRRLSPLRSQYEYAVRQYRAMKLSSWRKQLVWERSKADTAG